MLRKTSKWIPGVLIVTTGRFRLPGILCGILCLAVLSALPSPLAFAQQTVTIDDTRYGSVYGNSSYGGYSPDTDPNGNTLNIVTGAYITNYAYGARATGGAGATNNRVNMSDGTVDMNVYGGRATYGEAGNNTVEITGGTVKVNVTGGKSDSGNVTGNSVTISGGTVEERVHGGYVETGPGNAVGNIVRITGTADVREVFGGSGFSGDAAGNIVEISGGTVQRYVHGGYLEQSSDGDVAGNIVRISGGTVKQYVHSGYILAGTGNVTGNIVEISGSGKVDGNVGGGYNVESGNAADNIVRISGNSAVGGNVYGGYITDGNAMGNSVTIDGGTIAGAVYGGYVTYGHATGNSVTIGGGTMSGNVYGGRSTSGSVAGNSVTIGGGTVNGVVYGGYVAGDAFDVAGNSVTISGGKVTDTVYGGYIAGTTAKGNATGNSVTVSGGLMSGNVYGGRSASGKATGNSVTVSGGTVGSVSGGYVAGGALDAAGNSVTIGGGTVTGNVYGGRNAGAGNAMNNMVTISDYNGTLNISDSILYGGFSNGSGDVFTGNTFHLHGTSQPGTTPKLLHTLTAKGLANFQYMNFYVPDSAKDGDVMLEITGTADVTDSRIKVVFDVANSSLVTYDMVTLIDTSSPGAQLVGLPEGMSLNARGVQSYLTQVKKGALVVYDVEIAVEHESGIPDTAGQLNLYILGGASLLPEAGAVNDGFLPGIMQLNQGGNLVAGRTLAGKMLCAAKHPGFLDLGVFCDISGNWSSYHTNAQTDLSGTHLLLGLSRCFKLKPLYKGGQVTQLMLGGFFEHGNGSYDSFSAFSNGVNVRAGGKLDHYGGGVLGRWDFGKFRVGHGYAHSYLDGSFRAGSLRNRFHSDLRDGFDTPAGFTSSSPYHGTHVGVGRVRHFASGATFDLSGKYFWTHMQGESLELTTGDPVDFESVNSHRLRVGGRYNFVPSRRVTPYLGGAWEREFSGMARASTQGFAIPASSLRGDTGIGEVGIALKPTTSRGFFIDLGVQCYAGKRDGVAAALHAGRKF